MGRILENLVFLQLLRNGNEVYYFRNSAECDFLVKHQNKIARAIQVCYQLTEENAPREILGLKQAMETTKAKSGIILTQNQEDNVDGIPVLPAWKWCMGPL